MELLENIPRMIPAGLKAIIHKGTWPVLPIFELIAKQGNVEEMDMYNTFNMGLNGSGRGCGCFTGNYKP